MSCCWITLFHVCCYFQLLEGDGKANEDEEYYCGGGHEYYAAGEVGYDNGGDGCGEERPAVLGSVDSCLGVASNIAYHFIERVLVAGECKLWWFRLSPDNSTHHAKSKWNGSGRHLLWDKSIPRHLGKPAEKGRISTWRLIPEVLTISSHDCLECSSSILIVDWIWAISACTRTESASPSAWYLNRTARASS